MKRDRKKPRQDSQESLPEKEPGAQPAKISRGELAQNQPNGVSYAEWKGYVDEARLAGYLEFLKTGKTEAKDKRLRELARMLTTAEEAAEDLRRNSTPAGRWGLDRPDFFNMDCYTDEQAALSKGEANGEGEINHVCATVLSILGRLMEHARDGSPRALAAICKLAHESTCCVERLTRERIDAVREIAEQAPSFPILLSSHTDMSGRQYIEEKLRILNVGARAAINSSGYAMRASNGQPYKRTLHDLCERMVRILEIIRADVPLLNFTKRPEWVRAILELPPLSENTTRAEAGRWFEVAWATLRVATNGHPELVEGLDGVGVYKSEAIKQESIRESRFANGKQRGVYERLRKAWLARFVRRETE